MKQELNCSFPRMNLRCGLINEDNLLYSKLHLGVFSNVGIVANFDLFVSNL